MALRQLGCQTKAIKRPSSCLEDVVGERLNQDSPPTHFALIHISHDGVLRFDSSPSLQEDVPLYSIPASAGTS